MNKEVRVRFAPSPTGYLHVGGARTALFNYLFARNMGGRFILRIEDTDQTRFQQDALEEIFESMKWLGLEWDEGPEKGGEYGPYVQSERTDLYRKFTNQLIEEKKAYRCFCTPERLNQVREEQQKNKMQQGSGYDRHCRDLSADEEKKLLDAGTPFVVRLKIPDNKTITFTDMVRGDISYESGVLDDIVLLKSDGFPTYHLANVVDDYHMKISHVMRGDEWIASTPKHIVLYEAFGWAPPVFAHLPVILAEGGGKLSKRKGAASVLDYQKSGYLPEALLNFLSLLGWNPGDDREIMPCSEIVEAFTLDRISPKPSVFDEKKLEWMNGNYMAEYSSEELISIVKPAWDEAGWTKNSSDEYIKKVVDMMKGRSKKVTDLQDGVGFFFEDPSEYDPKASKKGLKAGVEKILKALADELEKTESFEESALEALYEKLAAELEVSAGKLFLPTRISLSGGSAGPGVYEMVALLGREIVCRRMRAAAEWIEKRDA